MAACFEKTAPRDYSQKYIIFGEGFSAVDNGRHCQDNCQQNRGGPHGRTMENPRDRDGGSQGSARIHGRKIPTDLGSLRVHDGKCRDRK